MSFRARSNLSYPSAEPGNTWVADVCSGCCRPFNQDAKEVGSRAKRACGPNPGQSRYSHASVHTYPSGPPLISVNIRGCKPRSPGFQPSSLTRLSSCRPGHRHTTRPRASVDVCQNVQHVLGQESTEQHLSVRSCPCARHESCVGSHWRRCQSASV